MSDGGGPTAGVPGPHGGRPLVTAGAPRGAAEVALVALHGRGATARGVVNLLDPVYRHGLAVLAPGAERSRWYPAPPTAPLDRNERHLDSALGVVDALVSHAVDALGVPPDHVVLAGFSQGGSVVAEHLARRPAAHTGVVLHGCLLGPEVDPGRYGGRLDGTPVFVAGGTEDRLVPPARVRATAGALRALGADVTERVYEGVGHEVSTAEFDHLDGLLAALVGDDDPVDGSTDSGGPVE